MKKIILATLAALVSLSVFAGGAFAAASAYKYRFDDVYSTSASGIGGQWVIAATSTDYAPPYGTERHTRGDRASVAFKTDANFVNWRDHVYSKNGKATYLNSTLDMTRRLPIDHIFMVMPETNVIANVEFEWASTSLNPGETFTSDVRIEEDSYHSIKASHGAVTGSPYTNWFTFDIEKVVKPTEYGTHRTYMTFHQNPTLTPSQTLKIPLIIANVANGYASKKPLGFRTILRETSSMGNIVAYDRFEWDVTRDETIGRSDWIFVPNPITGVSYQNYHLTTHISNYCGIRYALQRYDGNITGVQLRPSKWTIDLPTGVDDVYPELYLDELSHIAPGMITTYEDNYNIVTANQKIFRIYGVDMDKGNVHDLLLVQNQIRGNDLGQQSVGSNTVRGFRYTPLNADFIRDASCDLSAPALDMPDTGDDVMTLMTVNDNGGSPVVQTEVGTIKINAPIPERMQYASNDIVGLLPLHVTFNLDKSNHYISQKWNTFLDQWKKTGSIKDLFYNSFRMHMRANDAEGTDMDLFRWMKDQGVYNTNVKVFMDEARERITVSFIVMLVDSRKEPNPTDERGNAILLTDKDTASPMERKIMTLRDCNRNDEWDTTFYIRYVDYPNQDPDDPINPGGGGGGGGCNTGLPMLALLSLAAFHFALRRGEAKR